MDNRKTVKVLVVEDNARIKKSLVRTLEELGFLKKNITTKQDGSWGMRAINDNAKKEKYNSHSRLLKCPFDLILTDIEMPNKNGLEFIGEVRKIYPKDIIPILVISTRDDMSTVMDAAELGANGYIIKPFICDKVDEELKKHGK